MDYLQYLLYEVSKNIYMYHVLNLIINGLPSIRTKNKSKWKSK